MIEKVRLIVSTAEKESKRARKESARRSHLSEKEQCTLLPPTNRQKAQAKRFDEIEEWGIGKNKTDLSHVSVRRTALFKKWWQSLTDQKKRTDTGSKKRINSDQIHRRSVGHLIVIGLDEP